MSRDNYLIALLMLAVSLAATVACDQLRGDVPTTITLTSAEKVQAVKIAETRQELAFQRQQEQNVYQSEMEHLAERERDLNLQSTQLCFAIKKAHSIDPNKQYWLDEWRGELHKQ